MKRTKIRMGLAIALTAVLLVFIWGNSLLPGEVSGAFSQWVKDLLSRLFGRLPGDPQVGHGLLRKLAHFTEFACLGVSLCWLLSMLKQKFYIPLLCGFLVACTDETIQCFIPDRGPAIKDVAIDTAGVAVGIALLLVVAAIYHKIKNNKILEETKL